MSKLIQVRLRDGREVKVSAKRHAQISDSLRRLPIASTIDGPGLAITASELTAIETEAYKVPRLPREFRNFIPVKTNDPQWATGLAYRIRDRVGQAKRRAIGANDMPFVDINGSSALVEVSGGHVGYTFDLDEIEQCAHLGIPLSAEKADAAIEAFEDHMNTVALAGEAAANYPGFYNSTSVTVQHVTNGSWDSGAQTVANIVTDFNEFIQDGYDVSGTYMNAFALPGAAFAALATRQVPDTTMTILEWLKMKNLTTMATGQPIFIGQMAALSTAGADSKSRVVGYIKDERYCRFHIPMEITFEAPQQRDLQIVVPARYRYAPTEFPYIKSVRYLDHVLLADV